MASHDEHDEKSKKHGGGHGAHGGHGGGAHEEHEGAPEWLISFADNVTLMMGFFVIMLAVNMGPKGKGEGEAKGRDEPEENPISFLDAAVSIREAFNNPVDLNSVDPKEQTLIRHILERRGLGETEQDGPRGDEHDVQSLRPSKYYSVCGLISFERHSPVLSEAGRQSLVEVAKHVRGLRLIVDVRGHVSAAEAYGDPERGMRLSFDRAVAVGHALVELGVEWRQVRLVSCADNDRVKPTVYEAQGHTPNERVEIVVSDQVMPDYAPKPESVMPNTAPH